MGRRLWAQWCQEWAVYGTPLLVLLAAIPILSWVAVIMQDNGYLATTLFPILLFMLAMMGVGAWWIFQQDRWLGALMLWWCLSLLWTRTPHAFETTMLTVLGATALVLVTKLTAEQRLLAMRLVVIGGVAVALSALVQATGFDPVWWTEYGVVGTFGNTAYVAALMAIVLPFAPVWAVPILLGALIVTKASLAMLAAMLGLAWRFRRWMWLWGLLAVPAMGLMIALRGTGEFLRSQAFRFDIWQMAWAQMTWRTWLIGHGPGAWFDQIPKMQDALKVHPGYYFTYAHNEWLQLMWEGGAAVAVVCVLGWLWSHRAMFASPYGGSVVAILVLSGGWFIFHLSNVVPTILIVLAAAMAWEPVPAEERIPVGVRLSRALRRKGLVHA